jgi:hypothetical protein
VIREQLTRRHRKSGREEDLQLEQSLGATVPVAERMDPGEI